MSWIEGVGDEVTITLAIVLGLLIILLCWFSTGIVNGIREIPFISVIIVQLTRRRVRAQNAHSVDQPQSQNEAADSTPAEGPSQTSVTEPVTGQTSEHGASVSSPNAGIDTDESENKMSVNNVADSNEETESRHIEEITPVISRTCESESNKPETATVTDTAAGDAPLNSDVPVIDVPVTDVPVTDVPVTDVPVTALSDHELRQKRLDFYINGSSNKLENETVDVSQSENSSDKETDSNRIPVNASGDQSSNDAQNLPCGDSNNDSNPESAASRTQEHAENQPIIEESDAIRVRIKFFNDEQRLVTCSPMDTIGTFRRRHFSAELSESKLVRFIFNGQDLRNDSSTLQSHNIRDNCVVHCLITQPQQTHQPAGDGDDDGLDMGIYMFPLFGLLLSIVWYMRFMYRQFFNVTSTLTLGGITFLYMAAFLSTFRGRPHEHID